MVISARGSLQCKIEDDLSPGTCSLSDLSKTELKKICTRVGFDNAMDTIREQRDILLPSRADYVQEADKCLQLEVLVKDEPKQWNRMVKSLLHEQYLHFNELTSSDRHYVLIHYVQALTSRYATQLNLTKTTAVSRENTLQALETDKLVSIHRKAIEEDGGLNDDVFSRMFNVYLTDDFKFNKVDENFLLRQLVYLDRNALDSLVSGDVPDLPTRRSFARVGTAIVLVLCAALVFLTARFFFQTREKERRRTGTRHKKGGKKKKKKKRK